MFNVNHLGLVLPGDVWFFRPNYGMSGPESNWLWTVTKVVKRKNLVELEDGGWMPLSDFFELNSKPGSIQELPVLVARKMTPALLKKVIAARARFKKQVEDPMKRVRSEVAAVVAKLSALEEEIAEPDTWGL